MAMRSRQCQHGKDIKANVDERSGGFKIEFGRFFVSENRGDIRISRQLKHASDRWPTIDLTPVKELASGQMESKGIKLAGGQIDDWCWVTSGLADGDLNDLWLRLEHMEFKRRGYGGAGGFRPAQFFYGDRRVEDDGELFIASRSTDEMVAALLQKKRAQELMKKGIVPELSYGETYNVHSLENHSPRSPLREPLKVIVDVLYPNLSLLRAMAAAVHDSNQIAR